MDDGSLNPNPNRTFRAMANEDVFREDSIVGASDDFRRNEVSRFDKSGFKSLQDISEVDSVRMGTRRGNVAAKVGKFARPALDEEEDDDDDDENEEMDEDDDDDDDDDGDSGSGSRSSSSSKSSKQKGGVDKSRAKIPIEKRWRDVKFRTKRLNKKLKRLRREEVPLPDPKVQSIEDAEENIDFEEREFRQESFVKKGKMRIIMAGNVVEKGLHAVRRWVNVPISGWTDETLIPTIDDFDDALERLHDQIDGKFDMPPAVEILVLFVLSAISHCMIQAASSNPVVQEAIKKTFDRPEVAESVARTVYNNYKEKKDQGKIANGGGLAASSRSEFQGLTLGRVAHGVSQVAEMAMPDDDSEDEVGGHEQPWGGGPMLDKSLFGNIMENINMPEMLRDVAMNMEKSNETAETIPSGTVMTKSRRGRKPKSAAVTSNEDKSASLHFDF